MAMTSGVTMSVTSGVPIAVISVVPISVTSEVPKAATSMVPYQGSILKISFFFYINDMDLPCKPIPLCC